MMLCNLSFVHKQRAPPCGGNQGHWFVASWSLFCHHALVLQMSPLTALHSPSSPARCLAHSPKSHQPHQLSFPQTYQGQQCTQHCPTQHAHIQPAPSYTNPQQPPLLTVEQPRLVPAGWCGLHKEWKGPSVSALGLSRRQQFLPFPSSN